MLCERGAVPAAVHDHRGGHGTLLLLLPVQAADGVRARGEALRRLLRPLLLWGLRPLPGVPRAQEPGLPDALGMASQCREDGEGDDRRAPSGPRDDSLITYMMPVCVSSIGRLDRYCVLSHVISRFSFSVCPLPPPSCVGRIYV